MQASYVRVYSPTNWPVVYPLSLCYIHTVPISHAHLTQSHTFTHLLTWWSEYPMVHCNGTSRWSLIGSDHWTSLRDGSELLVVVSQWGGSRSSNSFWSCFCISSSCEEIKEIESRLFLNTLLTSAFILRLECHISHTLQSSSRKCHEELISNLHFLKRNHVRISSNKSWRVFFF